MTWDDLNRLLNTAKRNGWEFTQTWTGSATSVSFGKPDIQLTATFLLDNQQYIFRGGIRKIYQSENEFTTERINLAQLRNVLENG